MPLKHEKPSIEYMRELKATAKAAKAMLDFFLSGPHIPNDFPKDQILRHCEALVLLPEGTAGGSIVTLEAADADLTRIQQNNIPLPPDEDEEPSDDLRSSIERGGEVDSKLTQVNTAVRLAIECYRQESGDAIETDTSPEPSHGPNIDEERRATTDDATALENVARDTAEGFDAIRNSESEKADAFHRSLKDAEAQAKSTKGVLQHQNPRPSVAERLSRGLGKTATVLDLSGKGLKLGSDIGKDCNNTWAEIQRQGIDGVLTLVGTVGDGLSNIAKTINKHREEWKIEQQFIPENFDYVEVYNRLLRGDPVPDAWAPMVNELDFFWILKDKKVHHLDDVEISKIKGEVEKLSDATLFTNFIALKTLYITGTKITDLTPISQLYFLEELYCDGTKIKNLTPLAHLTLLKTLSISGTEIQELTALTNLEDLERLVFNKTAVDDITPLSKLTSLRMLFANNTKIKNIAPLINMHSLEYLDIGGTSVIDLTPLTNCLELKSLSIQNTKVTDTSVLDHIEGLEIHGP